MNGAVFPPGVSLVPLSREVFQVLARHTAFPWPVLSTQCKRQGVDPGALTAADLRGLIPHLASGVARFTSPDRGEQVRVELLALLR